VGQIVGRRDDRPRLLFDGHLDTVPVTSPERWSHDPLAADLADGAVWGRGAADMKGPLAAMLCAAAFTPREQLGGTVTVSASVAEETLEGAALRAIIEQNPVEMVVIGESTRMQVGVVQKGRAGVRIITRGRPAHSSAPDQGDNAVYSMLEAVRRVREIPLPRDDLLGPAMMELVEIVSSPFPGSSIVPDRCTTRWDRRLVRGETREEVLDRLNGALEGLPAEIGCGGRAVRCYTGTTLQKETDFHPAWETPRSSPLVQAALSAIAAAGIEARTCSIPFCTNGSACAGDLQLPTIVLGPGDPAQFHVVDEHIAIEDLASGAAVFAGIIHRLSQSPG
jgi:putative selenium metabolism hydrolase